MDIIISRQGPAKERIWEMGDKNEEIMHQITKEKKECTYYHEQNDCNYKMVKIFKNSGAQSKDQS